MDHLVQFWIWIQIIYNPDDDDPITPQHAYLRTRTNTLKKKSEFGHNKNSINTVQLKTKQNFNANFH